jgi:hypothetical protein
LRHALNETPSEFGIRLSRQFPKLTEKIDEIIGACNEEVYGERRISKERISTLRLALRALRSPIYWPSRMKVLMTRPGG